MVFVADRENYLTGVSLDGMTGYGPEFGAELPRKELWYAPSPELQPNRAITRVTHVTVYQTHNVPTEEKLSQFKQGEIGEDQLLPSHRSANQAPRPKTPIEFVKIYDDESSGQIANGQINLTKPIGVHGDETIMFVPSLDACHNFIPTFISELDPTTRKGLFEAAGNGFKKYSIQHPEVFDLSFGVTYGHWKSIGPDGVVHAMGTGHNYWAEESQGHSLIVPIEDFAPDLQGLYTNNLVGILAADKLVDTVNLGHDDFQLEEVSDDDEKILSSGAVTFTVKGELGDILARCGDQLLPYLEARMLQASADAIPLLKQYTGDERTELEIRKLFCGAIVIRQHPEKPSLTQIQIVTGLKMDDKAARGGIFTAQNIWVARHGVATLEEAERFHNDTDALVDAIKDADASSPTNHVYN